MNGKSTNSCIAPQRGTSPVREFSGQFHLLAHIAVTLLGTAFMLVYCLAYPTILKMEAACYFETSAVFQLS